MKGARGHVPGRGGWSFPLFTPSPQPQPIARNPTPPELAIQKYR